MVRRFVGALLIVLMAAGSTLLWIGIPVGRLYVASRVSDSAEPSMGRVAGTAPQARVQAPWYRSLRGDRAPARRRSVLDVVMVSSVALAVLCFAVWFFPLAGSRLPTS
jgi:hypothetical protein